MVPFVDLASDYQTNKEEIEKAIHKVLASGWFILGPCVEEFENNFSRYINTKAAVGVASGTEAIQLALVSAGVKLGDGVIVPANAYPTAFAIAASGAKPQLVDIDGETFLMDASQIEKTITKETKFIMAVHLYGQPVEMTSLLRIARKHKLILIEDCAQAHGATYKNKHVGSFGLSGCFSFYPTKNLGAYGDGGMVVTNSRKIAHQLRKLRNYGEEKRYESVALGINSRLDELQAAILTVKLKLLDKDNFRRQKAAEYYRYLLKKTDIQLLPERKLCRQVYHLFVIRVKNRDGLKEYLSKKGIMTGIHYPSPIHYQESFSYLGHKIGDFPVAEKACPEILSLPIFPQITKKQQEEVASSINEFYEK